MRGKGERSMEYNVKRNRRLEHSNIRQLFFIGHGSLILKYHEAIRYIV